MKTSPTGLKHLIAGFQLSCQAEGKSPKTIEWYTGFLNRFCRFLIANNISSEVSEIDPNQIRAFIRYLQTEARTPRSHQSLSGATVQGYVRTLKVFFAWVEREGYITSNPMAKIKLPRAVTKLINTFSTGQIPIPMRGPGWGFGVGVGVRIDTNVTPLLQSVGSYGWGGAAGTGYFADPEEDLFVIYFTQVMNRQMIPGGSYSEDIERMVYQALT